jgi:hypothetical protein
MELPAVRGPITRTLFEALQRNDFADPLPGLEETLDRSLRAHGDVLYDDDLQLALL